MAYQYAAFYAQRGDGPKALEWLETALRLRDPGLGESEDLTRSWTRCAKRRVSKQCDAGVEVPRAKSRCGSDGKLRVLLESGRRMADYGPMILPLLPTHYAP